LHFGSKKEADVQHESTAVDGTACAEFAGGIMICMML
jgi:hypothetical protein